MTNKTVHRGMSSDKWEALKSVGVKSRYVWVSCIAKMISAPFEMSDGTVAHMSTKVPYIQKPGKTYRKTAS